MMFEFIIALAQLAIWLCLIWVAREIAGLMFQNAVDMGMIQ